MKTIYMDYSATTPMKPEVIEVVTDAFKHHYGNASSIHHIGQEAKILLQQAREQVAQLIGAEAREIFFTAGGTESDNWAIQIALETKPGKHIITTNVEHHAVLHPLEALEKKGYRVTYLPVDEYGMVTPEQVEEAIEEDTILISVMYINNEIGSINPVEQIAEVAAKHGILFHTDGVQALGNTPIDMSTNKISMMSMSSHKIYGPKGVGALYIRKGVRTVPLIHGGAQERKVRAGTENIPGILGFAKAAELAGASLDQHIEKLSRLRDKLRDGIMNNISDAKYNGHPVLRHPGNVNICFKYIEGESLLLLLDMKGICASSGSACTSGSLDPSHVLMNIGLTHEIAHGSLRLTLGDFTTEQDVDTVIEEIKPIVERLREMSPLTE